MRIRWITPAEAAKLARKPAHAIEYDVRRHARNIVRKVSLDLDEQGRAVTIAYDLASIVRAYRPPNWRLRVAILELDRLIARSKSRARLLTHPLIPPIEPKD